MATCGVCRESCDDGDRHPRELCCGHTLCQDCVVSLLVSLPTPVCPLDLKVFEASPDDLQAKEAALQLMSRRRSPHSHPAVPEPREVASSGSRGGVRDVSRCSVCGQRFSEPRLLREHYRDHHPRKRPFACELCSHTFRSGQDLKAHRQGHVRATRERSSTEVSNSTAPGSSQQQSPRTTIVSKHFTCAECLKTFVTKSAVQTHLRAHIERMTGRRRGTRAGRRRSATGRDVVRCRHCSASLSSREALSRHLKLHLSEGKSFACSHCSKEFHRQDHLTLHLRTHTDVKPYECKQCCVRFGNLSHLNRHLATKSHAARASLGNDPV